MLAPPTSSDWTARVDPTKLKNRKFASSKGGSASAASSSAQGGISSVWTETPDEKRKRLADQVLGRGGDDGVALGAGKGRPAVTAADGDAERETQRRIAEYDARNRGSRSLMEQHQDRKVRRDGDRDGDARAGQRSKAKDKTGHGDEEEDDPSKRAFDREKDMGLGGRIGQVQKREMLKKAGDFGGRFERGKYL